MGLVETKLAIIPGAGMKFLVMLLISLVLVIFIAIH